MTENVVEAVAMAIATARAGRENAEESRFKGGNLWFEAKRDARAAIEAMREPTEAMIKANGRYDRNRAAEDWRAMLDAALSPGEQDG